MAQLACTGLARKGTKATNKHQLESGYREYVPAVTKPQIVTLSSDPLRGTPQGLGCRTEQTYTSTSLAPLLLSVVATLYRSENF
jgi:hypothetical protein